MNTKLYIFASIALIVGLLTGSVLLRAASVSPIVYVESAIEAIVKDDTDDKEPLPMDYRITFLGDIMLGRHVEYLMRQNGSEYPFLHVKDMVGSSTYVVGNFESSMAPVHVTTPSGGFTFSVDKTFLPAVASSGITHLSLANNHSLDYGLSGYQNARDNITALGLHWFGHASAVDTSSITYLTKEDLTVGIIGIHTLFVSPDEEQLKSLVEQMSAQSDMQIAYIHWGDEYKPVHNKAQSQLATLLVTLGIDAVIGHHPHVTQDIDSIDGVPVFYSLGNFIFDQYFSQDVQTGYVLELAVEVESLVFTIKPVTSIGTHSQPRFMTETERADFLTVLAEKSHPKYRDSIKLGKVIIPFTLAKS